MMKPSNRPILLLRFFQVFAILGAVPFLFNTIDIILHPLALPIDSAMGSRLLSGLLVAPLTLVIAILCIRRDPGNLIGWMLVTFAYGTSSVSMRLDLLPQSLALFSGNWFIGSFWIAFLLIPLYFPDGRLYPPGVNRWGNLLISLIFIFLVFSTIFNPTLTYLTPKGMLSSPNPFFIVEWDYTKVTRPLIPILLVAGLLVMILRYRGSSELQRLQLRWLLFGVVVQVGLSLIIFLAPDPLERFVSWLSTTYTLIIPTAIGIAMLRYRLYDINVIIRRTLIYTVLSGLLVLVYFGGVVIFQQVFRLLTGQASPLAIVLSTLIIAGLFNPLRGRVQNLIDRRFFRSKFNTEQTMETLSTYLRNEVDIDRLEDRLTITVSETLQPEHVSIWMKQSDSLSLPR